MEGGSAEGVVMDAKVQKRVVRAVVDCMVRWGMLETGDYVLSGVLWWEVEVFEGWYVCARVCLSDVARSRSGSP